MFTGFSTREDTAAEPLSLAAVLHHEKAFRRPHDIEVQGKLAFVPGKEGSLAIVDVEVPEQPKLLWWSKDDLGDSQTVLPRGDYLFLGAKHFVAIDIRDPIRPEVAGQVNDAPKTDSINGMVRRGEYVLAASKRGWVSVFDISNPATPVLVGALNARSQGGLVSPHDIALYGDTIVVVDQSRNSPLKLRLYRVADVQTHALLPVERWEVAGAIASDDLNGANRVVVGADHAFVACSQHDNFTLGVIDIRDPENPRHVRTLPFADIHPTGLEISGRVLFAAGGRAIEALDISDPANPKRLAVFRSEKLFPTGRDNAHDLVYRDGYLYVTAQNDDQMGIVRVGDGRIRELAESD